MYQKRWARKMLYRDLNWLLEGKRRKCRKARTFGMVIGALFVCFIVHSGKLCNLCRKGNCHPYTFSYLRLCLTLIWAFWNWWKNVCALTYRPVLSKQATVLGQESKNVFERKELYAAGLQLSICRDSKHELYTWISYILFPSWSKYTTVWAVCNYVVAEDARMERI